MANSFTEMMEKIFLKKMRARERKDAYNEYARKTSSPVTWDRHEYSIRKQF